MNAQEFIRYIDEKIKKQGFTSNWEALAVAHNWREVFGEDLPDDYVHSRDYQKLVNTISGGGLEGKT